MPAAAPMLRGGLILVIFRASLRLPKSSIFGMLVVLALSYYHCRAGERARVQRQQSTCVIELDGTAHVQEELDHPYPNGVVAAADGSIVWVKSYTLHIVRRLLRVDVRIAGMPLFTGAIS
jgi:hypothetical protein